MMRRAFSLIVLLVAGCAGAPPSAVETTAERFRAPEAETARERAPDIWAQADRARQEAEEAQRSGDSRAAADHATRARLLLAAAIAEADRLEVEERRLEMEEQARALEEQTSRDVTARLELQAEMGRRASARVAAQQAAMAFQRAAEDEGRRYRATNDERARLHREAADILLRRATLVLSAAEAMGATPARAAQVTDVIEEAEQTDEPALRMQRAHDAVRGAFVALGEARASREGPAPDEIAALREAASQAGFTVEQDDRGVVVRADGIFAGRAARPSPAARRRLAQLAAIVAAHPHGPVQVHSFVPGAALRRQADARAATVATELATEHVPRDRLLPEGVIEPGEDQDAIWLVFVAYRPADR